MADRRWTNIGKVLAGAGQREFQAGSAIAMSGPGMLLGIAPGQSAGATLLMLLTSPGGSPFRPVPVMIHSTQAPASGSGP